MLWSFIVGMLVGAALLRLAPPLWSQVRVRRAPRALLLAAAALAVIGLAAGSLYLALGSRLAAASRTGQALPAHAAAAAGAATPGNAGPARSMEAEVAALEARLARQGGSSEDWSLLAQAYDYLGRADDAQRARAHQASPGAGTEPLRLNPETLAAALAAAGDRSAVSAATAAAGTAAATAPSARQLEQRVAANDSQAWLAIAEARRTQRDYPGARDAYARLVQLNAMTAQSWADYADTLGSLGNGSLGGEAGRAIDRALALDPANAKALWLKASQLYEEHRYAESLAWWQKLKAVLPADSPDAPIVARNIDEAVALSGQPAGPQSVGTGAAVVGTVSLGARFAGRVPPDATLFIYAKAADAPGPPLAVMRIAAGSWPVSFRLDDSMAMMPSRRLSQFEHVVVEARISRSGQATPARGDLYVTSGVLRPGTAPRLTLVIDREIS